MTFPREKQLSLWRLFEILIFLSKEIKLPEHFIFSTQIQQFTWISAFQNIVLHLRNLCFFKCSKIITNIKNVLHAWLFNYFVSYMAIQLLCILHGYSTTLCPTWLFNYFEKILTLQQQYYLKIAMERLIPLSLVVHNIQIQIPLTGRMYHICTVSLWLLKSDCLRWESNFLASTRPVTALFVCICCIICA